MENASKALLIAAAVLIVILLIAFGMRIFGNSGNTAQEAQSVGTSISEKMESAASSIVYPDLEGSTSTTASGGSSDSGDSISTGGDGGSTGGATPTDEGGTLPGGDEITPITPGQLER